MKNILIIDEAVESHQDGKHCSRCRVCSAWQERGREGEEPQPAMAGALGLCGSNVTATSGGCAGHTSAGAGWPPLCVHE